MSNFEDLRNEIRSLRATKRGRESLRELKESASGVVTYLAREDRDDVVRTEEYRDALQRFFRARQDVKTLHPAFEGMLNNKLELDALAVFQVTVT